MYNKLVTAAGSTWTAAVRKGQTVKGWDGKQYTSDGRVWNLTEPGPMLREPSEGNPKHAAGMSKPPLHLVPSSAVILTAMVFQLGARKYGAFNWRESAVVRSIYLAAAMRHLLALMDGQDNDEESGLPHEAHVIACMAIVIDARECGKLIDDRGPAGAAAELLKRYTSHQR